MNDLKRKLRANDTRAGGNDGFVNPTIQCGCSLEARWPCGDGPFPGCETAKAVKIMDEYEASLCDSAMVGDTIYVPSHRYKNWSQ